jgi:hypothetical protein
VVEPDTRPPPAVTELLRRPAEVDDEFGGLSPGFRWTVLQLLFGPELEDVVLPSEDDALDELELSACAAAATAMASAAAQIDGFIANTPHAGLKKDARCKPIRRASGVPTHQSRSRPPRSLW